MPKEYNYNPAEDRASRKKRYKKRHKHGKQIKDMIKKRGIHRETD